jgi:hypothetical protein
MRIIVIARLIIARVGIGTLLSLKHGGALLVGSAAPGAARASRLFRENDWQGCHGVFWREAAAECRYRAGASQMKSCRWWW